MLTYRYLAVHKLFSIPKLRVTKPGKVEFKDASLNRNIP